MVLSPYKEKPFKFGIPMVKAVADEGDGLRFVEGVASTEDWDQQDEQILQDGIDFTPLLGTGKGDGGYINWNHKGDAKYLVGVPVKAGIISHNGQPAFWVKALLLPDNDEADYIWRFLHSLEKLNATGLVERSLGWSVEGGVHQKENGRIKKCTVRHVALTHEPVNKATFASIAKSMAVTETDPDEEPNGTEAAREQCEAENDEAEKALSSVSGAPLKLENLEGGERDDLDRGMTSILTGADLKRSLVGDLADSPWYDLEKGRFVGGYEGLLMHLAAKQHVPLFEAAEFISWLRRASA